MTEQILSPKAASEITVFRPDSRGELVEIGVIPPPGEWPTNGKPTMRKASGARTPLDQSLVSKAAHAKRRNITYTAAGHALNEARERGGK